MLNIDKWTNIDKTLEQRNNVLVSVFAIFGILFSSIQLLNDLYHNNYIATLMDGIIVLILGLVYLLNEKRKHKLAKIIFLVFINLTLFIYACIVPKEMGVFFIFFPMSSVSALIFSSDESKIRNALILLPFVLVFILELSDYHLFGMINIQEGIADTSSYFINLFISLTTLIFALLYLIKINKKIEDNKTQIEQELRTANKSLIKTNTELDHFVYCASHDLKAPLSSILGLINIAKLEVKEEKSLEYFNLINGRINKLNSFIIDIIDLSRNSRLELAKEKIDLAELVKNVIENNQYMENSNSIDFRTEVLTNGNLEIDRARFEVVLNNLISNAIKHHKTKGERYVIVSVKQNKKNLNITVKDNGTGICDEHKDKVFDMFYRGHGNSEGSGLGLYIVHEVITKMKGEITLNSKERIGTEINITIPI
ncbi:MAG: HAMP domain-containing histidine kinase [Cyclobacteriaceae bacterium]|nr:HAMP domain-containing histidine kinase [Cyclobacteriaceae bacterium]